MPKTLYVYILKCSDGSYYTGVTNNVERRFIEHNSGRNEKSYTASRRPVQLVFVRAFNSPMEAIRYEKQLKNWSRAKKEALIEGNFNKLHELASCKNSTAAPSHASATLGVTEPNSKPSGNAECSTRPGSHARCSNGSSGHARRSTSSSGHAKHSTGSGGHAKRSTGSGGHAERSRGVTLSLDIAPGNRELVLQTFRSGKTDWYRFVQTASANRVLQTLYPVLSRHNLLESLPPDLTGHLKMVYDLNVKRNRQILGQVKEINALLNPEGINPLYLKGVGNLLDGLYPDPGERIIQDIDLLVPDEQMEKAAAILSQAGYESRYIYNPERKFKAKHYPRLFKKEAAACVEIHYTPVKIKYRNDFPVEKIELHKKKVSEEYGTCYVMCDEHKLIHNFIHSQLDHHGHFYAMIFLRNMYDALLLSERTDPVKVFADFKKYRRKTAAYLEVMYKTFGITPPVDLQYPPLYLHLYSFRYNLNQRVPLAGIISHFFGYSVLVLIPKTFRSYIKKPFMAVADKKLRKHLLQCLKDPQWYRRQWKVYRKLFR